MFSVLFPVHLPFEEADTLGTYGKKTNGRHCSHGSTLSLRGQAVTIMLGLSFATVLTLVVVPVLYAEALKA
ncbi:MAG TPA: hypothetical protein PK773_00760 [Aminivibrio sp.]|nr:hypothetical protein [Aminivibrio sp.]